MVIMNQNPLTFSIGFILIPFLLLLSFLTDIGEIFTKLALPILGIALVSSVILGYFLSRKIIEDKNDQKLGAFFFAMAYMLFVAVLITSIASQYSWIIMPFLVVTILFLLIFPLVEWIKLVELSQTDAILPIQRNLEAVLEKFTAGDKKKVVIYYSVFIVVLITIIGLIFNNFLDAVLVTALLIPLINLGYISGISVGNDLLWFKVYREKRFGTGKKNILFHWFSVKWENRKFGFYPVGFGNIFDMVLALFLVLSTFYGVYNDILNVPIVGTAAFVLIVKSLIVNGRNAVKETERMWVVASHSDVLSRFNLFYPIYVGVSIFTIISTEIALKMNQDLFDLLGIQDAALGFLLAITLLKELAFFAGIAYTLRRSSDPIQIRQFTDEEFSMLSPVEQHAAIEKYYSNVHTLTEIEHQLSSLEKGIKLGTDRLNAEKLLPILVNPYNQIHERARQEVAALIKKHDWVGKMYLDLLEEESQSREIQNILVHELLNANYYQEVRELAKKKKIPAIMLKRPLPEHKNGASVVTCDDQHLYAELKKKKIGVWDVKTLHYKGTIEGHESPIKCIAYDDELIYTGSTGGSIKVWNKSDLSAVYELATDKNPILAMTITEDRVYGVSKKGTLLIWNKGTTEPLSINEISKKPLNGIAMEEDIVYMGGDDGKLYLYKIKDKKIEKKEEAKAIKGRIWSIALDEKYIYMGTNDKNTRLGVWDKKKLKLKHSLEGHESSVYSLVVDDDKDEIISSSHDRTIIVWDRKKMKRKYYLEGHTSQVRTVTADQHHIFASSWDNYITVWDRDTLKYLQSKEGHQDRINTLYRDGKYIYSGAGDATIKVWTIKHKRAELMTTIEGHEKPVRAITSDKEFLYSVGDDKMLIKYDKSSHEILEKKEIHERKIQDLKMDDEWLYTASDDKTLKIWSKELELIHTIEHEDGVRLVKIDPLNIVTASEDMVLHIWDRSFNLENEITFESRIRSVALDEEHIYVGLEGGMMHIIDRGNTENIKDIEAHSGCINEILINESFIYTCSNDRTLKIWHHLGDELNPITTMRPHHSWINAMIVHKTKIITGSSDRSISVSDAIDFRHLIWAFLPYILVFGGLYLIVLLLGNL